MRGSRGLVAGHEGTALRVVDGDGGEKDAGAVEIEVAAVDPEFAESEADGQGGVEELGVLARARETLT